MTDPRYTDPRQSDPVLTRDETASGVWGWVAGLAILALVAFVVIAGWNNDRNTASNNSSPAPATSAQRSMPAPSTTGSGLTSPQPTTPAPSTPAPANRGTR